MAVERALWAAIRSMEEQAEFSERFAQSSRRKRHLNLARRFTEKAQANRENATTLRDLLQRTSDEVLETPLKHPKSEFEDQTGTD